MNNRYGNIQMLKDNRERLATIKNIIEYFRENEIHIESLVMDQRSKLWRQPNTLYH